MGWIIEPESGRKRARWALVITLVCGRYQFVSPTFLRREHPGANTIE